MWIPPGKGGEARELAAYVVDLDIYCSQSVTLFKTFARVINY
jgi:hypothetical protein